MLSAFIGFLLASHFPQHDRVFLRYFEMLKLREKNVCYFGKNKPTALDIRRYGQTNENAVNAVLSVSYLV